MKNAAIKKRATQFNFRLYEKNINARIIMKCYADSLLGNHSFQSATFILNLYPMVIHSGQVIIAEFCVFEEQLGEMISAHVIRMNAECLSVIDLSETD